MNTSLRVVLLALLLSPGAARADMGFPGFKNIEWWVVVDNYDDYPEHHFYWIDPKELNQARPPSGGLPRAKHELLRSRGSKWLKLKGELIAVPRHYIDPEGQPDWNALVTGAPGILRFNPLPDFHGPASVFGIFPTDYEIHHYRIERVNGRLSLTPGSVERGTNSIYSWVPGILTMLALFALGRWIVRRARRSA